MRELQKGQLLQRFDRVSKDIAKFLVDLYEPAVKIGHRNAHRGLIEYGAVANFTGVQRGFGLALRRHVVKNHDCARQLARSIPDRAGGILNGGDGTVTADQGPVFGKAGVAPIPYHLRYLVFHGLAGMLVNDGEDP